MCYSLPIILALISYESSSIHLGWPRVNLLSCLNCSNSYFCFRIISYYCSKFSFAFCISSSEDLCDCYEEFCSYWFESEECSWVSRNWFSSFYIDWGNTCLLRIYHCKSLSLACMRSLLSEVLAGMGRLYETNPSLRIPCALYLRFSQGNDSTIYITRWFRFSLWFGLDGGKIEKSLFDLVLGWTVETSLVVKSVMTFWAIAWDSASIDY